MVEAPEGLLVYDVSVDGDGLVTELSVTAPLQFNLGALENHLAEVAHLILDGSEERERAANLLQMVVRAYAPCIPCGVH